jgi:hypothetical protein
MTKRKRFSPSPEVDAQTVLEIVNEITNLGRVSPPTAAERAERQQRDREHARRRRERDRIAEEERARKSQERRIAEQEKAEQERRAARAAAAEQARTAMAERQRQQQAAAERRQLSQLQHEWATFKFHAAQAQREQQREAYFQDLQGVIDGLGRVFNPPPPPEPQIIYVEKEEDTRWGKLPTLPTWR